MEKNRTTRMTYLRPLIQTASVVAVFYLFTRPLLLLLLLTIILGVALIIGRYYCGWLCPFALYRDLFIIIRKTTRIRHRNLSNKLDLTLHGVTYLLVVYFIALPFLLNLINPARCSQALFYADPFKPLRILLTPPIPLVVPWRSELVINENNFSYRYLQEINNYVGETYAASVTIIVGGFTIFGGSISRKFWSRFCPSGSSLTIVNRCRGFKWAPVLHISKDEEKCIKRGICGSLIRADNRNL